MKPNNRFSSATSSFCRLFKRISLWWQEKVHAYHILFDRDAETMRMVRRFLNDPNCVVASTAYLSSIARLGPAVEHLLPPIEAIFYDTAKDRDLRVHAAAAMIAIYPPDRQNEFLVAMAEEASIEFAGIIAEGLDMNNEEAAKRSVLTHVNLPVDLLVKMAASSNGSVLRTGFFQMSSRKFEVKSFELHAERYLLFGFC